jgi:PAS domain S-box-containing protein
MQTGPPMPTIFRRDEQYSFPVQVALGYAAFSVVWIVVWDRLSAGASIDDDVLLTIRRTVYVAAMALFLWWLVRREIRRIRGLEARFDAIADQRVVGVYIARKNRLVYVNDRLTEMVGFPREVLMSRPATDFLDPGEIEHATVHGWGLGEPEPFRRFLARRADGGSIPLHVVRRRVQLEDGPAWAGIVIDASRTEALEGHLKRSAAASHGSATAVAPLPAHAGMARGSSVRDAAWRARHTVLVVDDEPPVRRVIGAALRRQGYHVVEASDAPSALERTRDATTKIDLVICDFGLADETGLELANRMIALRPGLKVLFVTGFSRRDLVEQHPGLARFPFIEKPFSVEALTSEVDAMWEAESA